MSCCLYVYTITEGITTQVFKLENALTPPVGKSIEEGSSYEL